MSDDGEDTITIGGVTVPFDAIDEVLDELDTDGGGKLRLHVRRGGSLTSLDGERARRMQVTKTQTAREKREVQKEMGVARRRTAAAEVISAVNDALESDLAEGKSNEELADIIVQRMAKIVLMGGELFLPTSLKEVTETSKAWSGIAKQEADRRRQRLPNEPEATPVTDLEARLRELHAKMAKNARDKAIDRATS